MCWLCSGGTDALLMQAGRALQHSCAGWTRRCLLLPLVAHRSLQDGSNTAVAEILKSLNTKRCV